MITTQLLILGNGFDLHCGLKSSYKDFFENTILDNIGKNFGLVQMKIDDAGFWECLLLEYYRKYGDKDYNWCDIETIIKDTLWLIYFGGNHNSKNLNYGLFNNVLNIVKSGKNLLELEECKNNNINLLIMRFIYEFILTNKGSEEEKLHSFCLYLLQELKNFERRFCQYLKNNIRNPNDINKINNDYVINVINLFSELTGLSNLMINYIGKFIFTKIEFGKKTKRRNEKNLSNFFTEFNNTYILSFNYTMVFDILGIISPCVYGNVHGKICNEQCKCDCNSSNIIFGIDDKTIQSQDANSALRLFSKTYRKMLNASDQTSILPPIDNNVIEIKFYGHSLSEADYSYFQSIFDHYNLYDNNNVSLIFYYSKGYEQHDAIYKLINAYGKTLANKDQGKNLIHKLILENRLKIIKI